MKVREGARDRVRRNFGRIGKTIDIPNLIEVQKHSYDRFLQKDVMPEERKDFGLQSPFKSVFPIHDFNTHLKMPNTMKTSV
jgi:DNA-directed RNA polymerase subunit beta